MFTVNCRCSPTQFINDDQRLISDVAKHVGDLFHLSKESAHVVLHIVASAQARQKAVSHRHRGVLSRNKATYLRQNDDQRSLLDVHSL